MQKYFDLFSTFFRQNFKILVKKEQILQDLANNKKSPKMEKNGSVGPIKQDLFCFVIFLFMALESGTKKCISVKFDQPIKQYVISC